MYCTNCDNSKKIKGRQITHRYKESGLDNIVLDGVIEYRCPKCGDVSFSYGDITQLHGLIADILLTKEGLLSGKEIRFLRSHIGYSGRFFAQVLGIDQATLSRVENEEQKHSETLDKHVREAVFNKSPDRDYDLHDAMLNKPTHVEDRIELKVGKKKSWVPSIQVSPLLSTAR